MRHSGVLVAGLASLSTACAAQAEGPGKPVPGPCEAIRPFNEPIPREPLTCRYRYDAAGRLWHVDYDEGTDYYSDTTWTYDMDRLVEIRVVELHGQLGGYVDTVWAFEPDRVTTRSTRTNEPTGDEHTTVAEFGLDGFAFIGSPFQCDYDLTSSETIVRMMEEGEDVSIEYSYDGSFESGTRVRTGVELPSGEIVSTATFEYDDAKRLVHQLEQSLTRDLTFELTIERDEAGRILVQTDDTRIGETDRDTRVRSYRYDEFGNVLALQLTDSGSTSSDNWENEYDQTYDYDNGRCVAVAFESAK